MRGFSLSVDALRNSSDANQMDAPRIQVGMSDDSTWIDAVRRGDRNAFRAAVEAHARPLYVLCLRITREPLLAEDAVQEALNTGPQVGMFG